MNFDSPKDLALMQKLQYEILMAQGRTLAEQQAQQAGRCRKVEADLTSSFKFLSGLSGQLAACQTAQGLQILCKRAMFLKVGLSCRPGQTTESHRAG